MQFPTFSKTLSECSDIVSNIMGLEINFFNWFGRKCSCMVTETADYNKQFSVESNPEKPQL